MSIIHHREISATRSFVLSIYNASLQEKAAFSAPTSLAAPFCNRLFRETVGASNIKSREPWYALTPHCVHEGTLNRALKPEGPTSLMSERYTPESEPSPRVTLHPQAHIRYFTVRLTDYQSPTYEGQYSVDDIFLAAAEFLARSWIEKGHMAEEEGPFYYTVDTSADAVNSAPKDLFPEEAYRVEGVFHLPPPAKDRERTVFRKMKEPPLPIRDAASFGPAAVHRKGDGGTGRIYMRAEVYNALKDEIRLSDRVENGGYLLGTPYRDPGSAEDEQGADFRWCIEITDIIQAQNAFGQRGLLLFTGDSWSQATRILARDFADRRLVAWFHTHLFEATDDFGLSGLDQDLHRRFLTKPWQVAVLLNINSEGKRTVRCFQRGPEGDLIECAFQVMNPSPRSEAVQEA